jgi:hypothetical protein
MLEQIRIDSGTRKVGIKTTGNAAMSSLGRIEREGLKGEGDVRNPAATITPAIPNRFNSKLRVRTIKPDGDESVLRDQVYQPRNGRGWRFRAERWATDAGHLFGDQGTPYTKLAVYTAKYPQNQAQPVSSLRPYPVAAGGLGHTRLPLRTRVAAAATASSETLRAEPRHPPSPR